MKDGTERYLETVAYIGKAYNFLNEKLFYGELKKPVITVQRDERTKTNGWWSVNKVWKWKESADEKAYPEEKEEHELNLTASGLNRPVKEIFATLLHEMCHQYAGIRNLQDCSRSGQYHNKIFKRIAETHGLKCECVAKIGWSQTELNEETEKLVESFLTDNPADMIYRLPVSHGQLVKSSSTRKYVCPVCGNSCRATKQINLICADCNEPMTEEN